MSLLNKFRSDTEKLNKAWRDDLDNLSDDDKVKKIDDILKKVKEYNIIVGRKYYILEDIVLYYNLQDNEKLKDLMIRTFGKNPKYSYMCATLIQKRIPELEEIINQDLAYLEYYNKFMQSIELSNE
jgi:hypothetical protein